MYWPADTLSASQKRLHCMEHVRVFVGLAVLTSVVMKSTVFRDIAACSPLKVYRRFRGTCRLHLQGRRKRWERNQPKSTCHLPLRWFLARHILRPWRWRGYIPPNCRLAFNGLHGVISQKTVCTLQVREFFVRRLKDMTTVRACEMEHSRAILDEYLGENKQLPLNWEMERYTSTSWWFGGWKLRGLIEVLMQYQKLPCYMCLVTCHGLIYWWQICLIFFLLFEVLIAVTMKSTAFWDTTCNPAQNSLTFGRNAGEFLPD
jgi:hypothetical protein